MVAGGHERTSGFDHRQGLLPTPGSIQPVPNGLPKLSDLLLYGNRLTEAGKVELRAACGRRVKLLL